VSFTSRDLAGLFLFVLALVVGTLWVSLITTAQPTDLRAPPDHKYDHTGKDENQVVNSSTGKSKWHVRANRYRNALFVVEGANFVHQKAPEKIYRPVKLGLSKRGGNRWRVIKAEDQSEVGNPAEVMAEKNKPGGGNVSFQVSVTFVEEGTGLAPSGKYKMTLQGTIRAGN